MTVQSIRRFFSRLVLCCGGIALLYVIGFAFFVLTLPGRPTPGTTVPALDGIAVFTGGAGRVLTGFSTFSSGFDGPLLITGVFPGVTLDTLVQDLFLSESQRQQVELDYTALSTRENVLVTRGWAERHLIRHVGLVTAYYHIPRSMMLFQAFAPDLDVQPLPVFPQKVPMVALVKEYTKFLLALGQVLPQTV